MKHKDFTEFLWEKFLAQNPAEFVVLDDDGPDAFADWQADLEVETLIKWADEYAAERK